MRERWAAASCSEDGPVLLHKWNFRDDIALGEKEEGGERRLRGGGNRPWKWRVRYAFAPRSLELAAGAALGTNYCYFFTFFHLRSGLLWRYECSLLPIARF